MNFILREVPCQQEIISRSDHVLRRDSEKEGKMVESDHMIKTGEGRQDALHIWCNYHNTLVLELF